MRHVGQVRAEGQRARRMKAAAKGAQTKAHRDNGDDDGVTAIRHNKQKVTVACRRQSANYQSQMGNLFLKPHLGSRLGPLEPRWLHI